MRKEAFLWRSSKHLELQTLIHLYHRLNVDIMNHQCSIATVMRLVNGTAPYKFIGELEKSDKAKIEVLHFVSSSM